MKLRQLAGMALGVATFSAASLATSSALAVEPAVVHEGGSVAGLIGFGANAYGFSVGARGGYTLPSHVYLGGTALLNVGFGGWGAGFTGGFEGGYEFAAGPVTVRPYGGVGFVVEQYNGYYGGGTYNATLCGLYGGVYCNNGGAYGGGSSFSFAFWVGGTAIYDFKGGPWFVAADIRMGDAPALFYQQVIFAFMPGGGYEF